GKLDLTDGDLIVRSGSIGSWNGSSYSGILGLVQAGRGNGTWNGNGIITSRTEARAPSILTTLAASRASDALGISASQTSVWSGHTVNGNAILVAHTFGGDAKLDGVVNGDDYFQIDSQVSQSGSVFGYFNGDFNYDGAVNGDDYFVIDSNVSASGL